jgi:hypothetical protein
MTKLPAPSLLQSQGIEFLYRPGDTPMLGQPRARDGPGGSRGEGGPAGGKDAIDAVAGTDLVNCTGCAQRKAALNKILPG